MLEFLSSVPAVLWYLITLLAVVLIWFLALKRPVYEAVLVAFIVLVTISGTWGQFPQFVKEALSEKTLYSMTAFVAMSVILTKTKVMDGVIAIILALLGRIPGGTGYVSVLASSFMGAMSGSGPGNVMATGAITPRDSARATRCVSRWAWHSTATTSTTPSLRSRPTSRGW
jgi:TRAP-type C4-dicarboxylate transport system permease large subunit